MKLVEFATAGRLRRRYRAAKILKFSQVVRSLTFH